MSDERDNIVVLLDGDNNELEFEYLDSMQCKGKNYAALLPVDDNDGSVYIFEIVEDEEGNSFFEAVEDEVVIDEVFEIFRENNADEFDFSEE